MENRKVSAALAGKSSEILQYSIANYSHFHKIQNFFRFPRNKNNALKNSLPNQCGKEYYYYTSTQYFEQRSFNRLD